MIWLTFAILCALFAAGCTLVEKRTLFKQHAMEFSATLALINLVFTIPIFFIIDYSKIDLVPVLIIIVAATMASVAFLFVAKCIRHTEVSSSAPLFALGPGIIAILAFLILGEKLTPLQIGGLVLLVLGSYVLETKPHHNLLEPIKVFRKSRYIHFMLLALLIYGFTAIADRYVFTHYPIQPMAYLAIAHIVLAIDFVIMMTIFHDGFMGIVRGARKAGIWIIAMSIALITARLMYMYAIKMAYVGLVAAIKRTSVFFAVVLGGEFFHENNVLRKAIASMIMIGGAVLIAL